MKKAFIKLILVLPLLILLTYISPVYAVIAGPAPTTPPYGLGCGEGMGPIAKLLCGSTTGEVVGRQLNKILSGIIGFLTIVAALWFFIQFILAGFAWISAGGDKAAIETARNKITNALIGLIIVAAAWVIIGVLGTIFGIDILNPGTIIQTLGII